MKKTKMLPISCILFLLTALPCGCAGKTQDTVITPTNIPAKSSQQPAPTAALTELPSLTPEITQPPTAVLTEHPGETAIVTTPPITILTQPPSPTAETTTEAATTLPSSPSGEPTPEISLQPAATLTTSPTTTPIANTPIPSPSKPPTQTPAPPTPAATPLPDYGYYQNAWLPSVELTEENFPDEAFRKLLSELVDIDQDGILTLAERETLVYLKDTFYDPVLESFWPDDPYEKQMMDFVMKMNDLTGIEYFPQLKTIYMGLAGEKGQPLHPTYSIKCLPNLEEFYFYTMNNISESTCHFVFEHLPKLRSAQIIINNPESTSYISLNDTEELQEFRVTGNVAALDGLEQTKVKKMVLKFDGISGDLSLFSNGESEFIFDLAKFTNLNELHLYLPEGSKTYLFSSAPALETFGVDAFRGTVIFRDMPALQDLRVLGGAAVKSENCPNIEVLKLAMSGTLDYLDLSSFSSIKVLEIAWKTMSVHSLLLPNDKVDIATLYGIGQTTITYQEQPLFEKMRQVFETALAKPATLSGSAIHYETVSAEALSSPGIFQFVCTPGHGYKIDLDGDGIEEELYTDLTDFYINSTGLAISRNKYAKSPNPWETFWIMVPEGDTQKRNLILNTAPLERFDYSMHASATSLPANYWDADDPMEWGGKADLERYIPNYYIGQFLTSYDGNLHLQAYVEGAHHDVFNITPAFYPFLESVYDLKGISFPDIEEKWIRLYGTEEIPSLYQSNNSY